MERTSSQVPFPLFKTWLDYRYRACTIPYRFPSDPPQVTQTELAWIQVFRRSIASFKKVAETDESVEDAPARAAKFSERYGKILDQLESNPFSNGGPPDPIVLTRLRELCLREVGFCDIYKKMKDEENEKSLALFPSVVEAADKIKDAGERIEHLIKGIFAGNIYDLGVSQLAEKFDEKACSFFESCEQLLPRPWVIDDLDRFKQKWLRKTWKKAVIFVDNAGSDVVLGILPFARELLRRGTKVVLAANDMPSINDITYFELQEIVFKVKDKNGGDSILGVDSSQLLVLNSGNDLPVIDLSTVSPELAYASEDADLVVLEGMGRAVETNLFAEFKCDSLKIAMVKHKEVADFLGGRLYDCVIKFTETIS